MGFLTDEMKTVYGSCSLGCAFYTNDLTVGCYQIALTTAVCPFFSCYEKSFSCPEITNKTNQQTFNELKPTAQENKQGFISGAMWEL